MYVGDLYNLLIYCFDLPKSFAKNPCSTSTLTIFGTLVNNFVSWSELEKLLDSFNNLIYNIYNLNRFWLYFTFGWNQQFISFSFLKDDNKYILRIIINYYNAENAKILNRLFMYTRSLRRKGRNLFRKSLSSWRFNPYEKP